MKEKKIIENGFFVKFIDDDGEYQYFLHFNVRNFLVDFDENVSLPSLWFAEDIRKLVYGDDVARLATCWNMDYQDGCGMVNIQTKNHHILFKKMVDYFEADIIKISKEDADNNRFTYIENILFCQETKNKIISKLNKPDIKNKTKI